MNLVWLMLLFWNRPDAVDKAPGVQKVGEFKLVASRHLLADIPAMDNQGAAHVIVTMPAGTTEVWHVDPTAGSLIHVFHDGSPLRVNYLGCPANLGFVPRTKSVDVGKDPLEVMVLGAVEPRAGLLRVRVLGVLHLAQSSTTKQVLIGAPMESSMGEARDLTQLKRQYPGAVTLLTTWFENVHRANPWTVTSLGDEKEARAVLGEAMARYTRNSGIRP